MDELDAIADKLRQRRKELAEEMESTTSRSGNTADLLGKIEDLRRRAEDTNRRFNASVAESGTPAK